MGKIRKTPLCTTVRYSTRRIAENGQACDNAIAISLFLLSFPFSSLDPFLSLIAGTASSFQTSPPPWKFNGQWQVNQAQAQSQSYVAAVPYLSHFNLWSIHHPSPINPSLVSSHRSIRPSAARNQRHPGRSVELLTTNYSSTVYL